jgi:hypothetical protein
MNQRHVRLLAALAIVALLGACDESQSGNRNGSDGGVCGAVWCTGDQLCVTPSCGGAPPQCIGVPTGGCPSGWTLVGRCPDPGLDVPGCMAPVCTPPPPFCTDIPVACDGTPSCSCLPATICGGGGGCGSVAGNQVSCASA